MRKGAAPHPQVWRSDLQPAAHVQEVRHASDLQDDIDGHAPLDDGVQQVLEDMQISEEVHDYSNHLQCRGKGAIGEWGRGAVMKVFL